MLKFIIKYKDIFLPVLAAVLAFFGGLFGAQFQLPINVQFEQQKTLLELRKTAYTDYFEGQAIAMVRDRYPKEKLDIQENLVRVAKSKFFVAVFSTKPVAVSMASYFRVYLQPPVCDGTRQRFVDDARTYHQMRQEIFGSDASQKLSDEDMLLLLFDCRMP